MKTITLKSSGIGRYDEVSPFMITDNKLQIKVELPNYNGEFYFVAESGGAVQKLLLPRDGEITLTELAAGELNAEVKHYIKGVQIKSYKIEPLILKEADGTLAAMPEIEALTRRICTVERDFAEYKQTAENKEREQAERLKNAEGNLLALVRFAFKDNKESPYLNGGTLDKFIKEYGFNLSEEQLKLIKGENGNE